LELFRESQITLEQESPLADLYIRWVGSEQGEIELTDEFDTETKLSLVKDTDIEEVPNGE
jgi:segregation and condensation protein A